MAMLKIILLWMMLKLLSNKIKFLTILLLHPNHLLSKCLLNQIWQSFGLIYGMSKVVVKPRLLLTDASMLVSSLWLLEVLTWTLKFCNVKIARNRVISHFCVESKGSNVLSAMGLTSLKTIMSLASVTKLTQRQIFLILKWRKANCVLIPSNVLTIKAIIKQIQTHVIFGDIDSIEIDIRRNMLRSVKTGPIQFIQL